MVRVEDMTGDELSGVVGTLAVDTLAEAVSIFTARERRALLAGDMVAATEAMECRIVCGVELDRRTGAHRAGSN